MSPASVLSSGPAPHRARTASVIGREHVRLGRNNQDGVFAVELAGGRASTGSARAEVIPPGASPSEPTIHPELVEGCRTPVPTRVTTAVLCDGCGSEPRSEIGAQLGSRFLAQWLATEAPRGPLEGALAERATSALVDWLGRFSALMEPDPSRRAGFVQAQLLFTFLAAVAVEGRALVFGLGDGAVHVDGLTRVLDAGPDNAPDYAAYGLLGAKVSPAVHFLGDAARVALATDGLSAHLSQSPRALEPLLDDPAVWKNPAQLQRRLNVLAAKERFLDDVTIALLRREV